MVNGHTTVVLTACTRSQRSLSVLRPNQALCECRILLFAIFPMIVAYRTRMYRIRVAGEVSLTPGAVISGWFP